MIQKYLKIILLCASIVLISGFLCGCATNKHLEIQQSFKPPINYPGKWIKVGTQRIYVTCGAPDDSSYKFHRYIKNPVINGYYVLVKKTGYTHIKWSIVKIGTNLKKYIDIRGPNEEVFVVDPYQNIVQPMFRQWYRLGADRCDYFAKAFNNMHDTNLTKVKIFASDYIPGIFYYQWMFCSHL